MRNYHNHEPIPEMNLLLIRNRSKDDDVIVKQEREENPEAIEHVSQFLTKNTFTCDCDSGFESNDSSLIYSHIFWCADSTVYKELIEATVNYDHSIRGKMNRMAVLESMTQQL